MPLPKALCLIALLAAPVEAQDSQARSSQQKSLQEALAEQIRDVNIDELSDKDAVSACLESSAAFFEIGRAKEAEEFFDKAQRRADGDPLRFQFRLLSHALKLGDFPAAEKIAEGSKQKQRMLDRLAIEKYRRGDDESLQGFPRSELDFYIAIDLAHAYADRRQYEKLEKFVTGITSLPSNEPTDVGAIVWTKVAKEFREKGDLKRAKEFIDKAVKIGGNNYYTGFSTRAAHLGLHGGLAEEAEKYAKRAVAYGSHFTRELLGHLINELVAAGHYDLAHEMLSHFPTKKERQEGQKYLAYHLARADQFDQATKLARAISDPSESAGARLYVAGELLSADRSDQARKLALEAESLVKGLEDPIAEYRRRALLEVLARLGEQERVLQLVAAAPTPVDKVLRAAAALKATASTK